ncbi:CAP domain-containing protein [Roseovarius salinarum]|uniref:CAP domain-containing protein n=1 Tax=Roseovarius salinarum TaxID=1981892 RepID=UPI000C342FCA|nr:CAP domain-containing protein [Roseovarius salinarum]
MRRSARVILLLMVALAVAAPAGAQAVTDLGVSARASINAIRAQHGRGALRVDDRLAAAAVAHARDMAARGFFGHAGSDGAGVGDRVRRQGYGFCVVAENLARGRGSLSAVLAGWMKSRPHRRNLLNRRVTGYGLVLGPDSTWVMVLGRPGC